VTTPSTVSPRAVARAGLTAVLGMNAVLVTVLYATAGWTAGSAWTG
jgi:hypothetical protein